MKLSKFLAIASVALAGSLQPAFSQVFWNNQSPSGLTDDVWCVTYANGTFAATTSQGRVLTSPDGLTWSSETVVEGTWLVSIAYGGGQWVAVGAGGAILTSPDLKSWVNATTVTTNKLNGIVYANGIFVAVGDSATVVTSPDGLNWTVQTVPAASGVTGFLHGITWSAAYGVFFISGAEAGNGTGATDVGAVLQMAGTPNQGTQLYPVNVVKTDSNGVGTGAGIGSGLLNPGGAGTVGNLEAILSEPNMTPGTVAVGWDGTILSGSIYGGSDTGLAVATGVPAVTYRGLAYGEGYWVVAGENGTILSSQDGVNWTQRFAGNSPSSLSTSTFLSATFSPTLQRFVVTGTGGTILVSNPTPSVFANVSTRGYVSSSQTFIGGFVVEGKASRTILVRADGPVLGSFNVAGRLPDPVLTVYDNKGNVVATNTGWTKGTTTSQVIAAAAQAVGAFALPSTGADSALLLTLAPGAYTAQITSAGGNSGIALFEAYTY